MSRKNRGGSFHPSRISNRAKMERKRGYDKLMEEKKRKPITPIDFKQDWSIK